MTARQQRHQHPLEHQVLPDDDLFDFKQQSAQFGRSLDDGFVPPIFDGDVLDRKTIVRNRESIEWTRRLLDECGVFAGISSGAAIAGAAKVASRMESGTIVTLLPDGGWKYLSSGAWTDDLDIVEERASRINYW